MRAHIQRATSGKIVNAIRGFAVMIPKLPHVERSSHPKDNFLLALSEAGNADLLVSGDKRDVLALRRHIATRIVTAREALDVLGIEND